jgi:hypothetical protein
MRKCCGMGPVLLWCALNVNQIVSFKGQGFVCFYYLFNGLGLFEMNVKIVEFVLLEYIFFFFLGIFYYVNEFIFIIMHMFVIFISICNPTLHIAGSCVFIWCMHTSHNQWGPVR